MLQKKNYAKLASKSCMQHDHGVASSLTHHIDFAKHERIANWNKKVCKGRNQVLQNNMREKHTVTRQVKKSLRRTNSKLMEYKAGINKKRTENRLTRTKTKISTLFFLLLINVLSSTLLFKLCKFLLDHTSPLYTAEDYFLVKYHINAQILSK